MGKPFVDEFEADYGLINLLFPKQSQVSSPLSVQTLPWYYNSIEYVPTLMLNDIFILDLVLLDGLGKAQAHCLASNPFSHIWCDNSCPLIFLLMLGQSSFKNHTDMHCIHSPSVRCIQ